MSDPVDGPLSPTEELILEVLAGRYRLGESIWPFASNSTASRAANTLERRGLVIKGGGQVENTFRLSLTRQGIKERGLDKPYTPPNQGNTVIPDAAQRERDWYASIKAQGPVTLHTSDPGTSRFPAARTTKTRADDWKDGFDEGWAQRGKRLP